MTGPHRVALRRVWWIMLRGGSGGAAGRAWLGHTWSASATEAVDLPLVLPAAQEQAKACPHGGSILIEAGGEALDHPLATASTYAAPEATFQLCSFGDDRTLKAAAASQFTKLASSRVLIGLRTRTTE